MPKHKNTNIRKDVFPDCGCRHDGTITESLVQKMSEYDQQSHPEHAAKQSKLA